MASTPVTPELSKILQDVTLKRQEQIARGYTPEHDDGHSARDMVKFANWRFTSPKLHRDYWFGRESFIEAIAVLVAAVEVMDRREARNRERT